MAKHTCAICGAEVSLLSEQKLADGNYICRKTCGKKCFRTFDKVAATLADVQAHIAQIEHGTRVWNQIFVPLKSTRVKEEKLEQVYGIKDYIVYVSPSTGLIAFNENRYKFMFFGKTELACVYRLADLVTYEYDSETQKNSEGKEETKHFCWFGFRDTPGMAYFRVEINGTSDFDSLEKTFNEMFGIQKTVRNMFNNGKRGIDAAKAIFGAAKAVRDGTIDEAQAASTMEAINAVEMGDRSGWIAKADAALSRVK